MKGEHKSADNLVVSMGALTIVITIITGYWMPFLMFAFLLVVGYGLQWLGRDYLYEHAYDTGYRDGYGDGKGWTDTKGEKGKTDP